MLTSLDPVYTFQDGPAYIVGDYPYVTSGDKAKVYIPALMTEIDYYKYEKENVARTAEQTVFANENHPIISGSVITINYIEGEISEDLITKRANADLYKNTTGNNYITHIPRTVSLSAGTVVGTDSDLGLFDDIKLY